MQSVGKESGGGPAPQLKQEDSGSVARSAAYPERSSIFDARWIADPNATSFKAAAGGGGGVLVPEEHAHSLHPQPVTTAQPRTVIQGTVPVALPACSLSLVLSQSAATAAAHMASQPPVSQTTAQQQAVAAATAVINASQIASGTAPSSATTESGSSSAASSQFQRLKVEDALSYLDQVKLQFGNQPQVYNDFLDIMKEFKSQSIDTPGVISRVSNLFKGHPDLIVGFNTFLPPGFKIEVHQNEINISGPAQHSQTLQKIAAQHNSSTAAAAAALAASSASSGANGSSHATPSSNGSRPSPGSQPSQGSASTSSHQPVEFNHAITYVNKIKNRFQHHPDIYKAFLEILHTYQKEQRVIKDGGEPSTIPLTETQVYQQVSKLFQNQEDLLSEFGQFLPDATTGYSALLGHTVPSKKPSLGTGSGKTGKPLHSRKGSQSGGNSSGPKKPKSSAKDVLAEAGKHTNYAELALFDKIRKALRNQEVYDNFLRCLVLFNEEIISRGELVHLVTPFLGKFPDLFSSFKTLLGFREPGLPEQLPTSTPAPPFPPKDRLTEFAAEIDYKSLKRHGASYRALPKTYVQPKCSGRNALCREVLNDTWVSFPMWSEDSTFEGTRKTQFEEYIFRCEDERFELDVVLETNLSTIRYLEALLKKLNKVPPEDGSKVAVDNALGGNSKVLQRKAIHRIYGDKAPDIIEGIKKNPGVAVPVVLKRLKGKQEEWSEAQKAFNKTWRDQLEKYHLKSLDHQGINFKALDTRAMRSKSLTAEIETIFDERQEQLSEGASASGPHLLFSMPEDYCVFNDAIGLILYVTRRTPSVHRSDMLKMRSFLTHSVADLAFYPRPELSTTAAAAATAAAGEEEEEGGLSGGGESDSDSMEVESAFHQESDRKAAVKSVPEVLVPEPLPQFSEMDYHVIFANNSFYTFFRLFQFLCGRLNKIYQQSLASLSSEEQSSASAESNIAIKLGLRRPPEIMVDEYYPTFLNMAKNFMEGNIDLQSYEDTIREMFGVQAYVTFTIDRLVQNIVRQLQTIVTDDNCYQIMELYSMFIEQLSGSNTSAESRTGLEMVYQRKAETLLGDDNCYRVLLHKADHKMTIELLDTDEQMVENVCPDMKKWQSYVESYSKPEVEVAPDLRDILSQRKIFLARNRRTRAVGPSLGEEEEAKLVRQLLPEMMIVGAIEFKMDKKSYRMIPLANSEDYLYNKLALNKAREVNAAVVLRKHRKFTEWHSSWVQKECLPDDVKKCSDWLLGVANSNGSEHATERVSEKHCGHDRNRYITTFATPSAAMATEC